MKNIRMLKNKNYDTEKIRLTLSIHDTNSVYTPYRIYQKYSIWLSSTMCVGLLTAVMARAVENKT